MNKFSLFPLWAALPLPKLFSIFLFFCITVGYTQTVTVTGSTSDASGVLAGVTIQVKDKAQGTLSDELGNYTLSVLPTDTLVFSFVGYKTVEVAVGNQYVFNVVLQEDTTQLREVIVNAGYYTVKEKERTSSISSISANDIEKQPVTNLLATMQGRMAGVDIRQDSGSPGGGFSIKIRGQNSLRADGNEPLYIINGVPYSSETIGAISTSGFSPSLTSPLNSINPSDIESIEVLKDADATAIYGSRGANGVVLITTKKGKAGATSFTVNSSTSFGTVTRLPKLMNTQQYLAMRELAFANDGVTTYPSYAYDVNGTWDRNRYTNWQKEFIGGTANITNVQASVFGGSSQTKYLLSGTYRNETTVYPGDFNYKKGAAHFSMDHKSVDEKFTLTFSGTYSSQKNNQPTVNLTAISRTLSPNAPAIYDEEGNLNWEDSTWDNPLAVLQSKFTSKTKDLVANTLLSYTIFKNTSLKSSFGYSDLTNNELNAQPSTIYNPAYGVGSEISFLSTNLTNRTSWIAEPQLHWHASTGKGKVEALVGSTFQQQKTNRLYINGYGFASNSLLNDLASASLKTVDLSDETIYKYQAFFARLNYTYDNRYIVNVTGRRDGSSRFGPGKQFATFGAVGAAWLFSKESFLADNSVLSFGKLRASYGTTGNDQIGDYQFLDTYASSGTNYEGTIGLDPTRLFNPAFGWETSKKFEVAVETGYFNDRIFLTAAYYRNRSSNQLVGIPLPGTTGFPSLNGNLDATVQNSGLELTLRTVNFQRKNFDWTTNFNISASRNKLISYPGLEGSTYANLYVVGEPTSIIKIYHYTGMSSATGAYEFEDLNGDGIITAAGDRKAVADLNPKFFGGLQNQFKYKNLQLDFLFQFVKQQAFSSINGVPGLAINQLATVSDAENQQPFTAGGNSALTTAYSRYVRSDAAIEDASYVRLKNISLTYDLPLLRHQKIQCQLYLQGQNLLTFTKYKSGDPETKFTNVLPPLKVFTVGTKLTF
ncbi:SusC/RagA family TonB-linked outer membrane protein [Flavobacterium gelidilacus]|uniref:SusC/RagA family TonB-linked outer membrane protein n=1 Tax=Flavobacterium gelidilacus TaxID=206041 RepID=UPI0003FF3146|nr:SusC/RagA family TonB-linked outer membrane protein [Flavobacterium gelidilacus]